MASTVDKNSSRSMEVGTESHQRFLERTQLEISRAERYCLFLSLIMVDLSEFARAMVNRQGQLKIDLDTVCSQIEAGLRNSLRLSDVISTFEKNRLGILLVETSKANVDNVRKELRHSFVTISRADLVCLLNLRWRFARHHILRSPIGSQRLRRF